ncbi:TetR/AcrR family transcriptional regulator [Actinomadura rubrisoli]|uniref:TetR/AcrR family transcriptional regulator n=1 Tax=Actinomadura rubrisoli TaxID=2530368 RepID=A0A4R5A6E5_9ACTN|nr:TetR/AcrR family transcriptional regulator [Actinomadura rubrisoli]TDD67678.1 TetR/AcrR family transcriptional regulator [Actinomadura rubrisoli]
MPIRARDRLVQAAEELFYAEGIRAVGVERLLTVSGVGRASFYRHFTGKDELVATVLRERDRKWRSGLEEAVAERGGHPLAVFDVMAGRFESGGFHGCSFINAMAETAGTDDGVRRLASEHKRAVAAFFARLLAETGHEARAGELAQQFVLLLDGSIVTALREGTAEPACRARMIAETLLAADGGSA